MLSDSIAGELANVEKFLLIWIENSKREIPRETLSDQSKTA